MENPRWELLFASSGTSTAPTTAKPTISSHRKWYELCGTESTTGTPCQRDAVEHVPALLCPGTSSSFPKSQLGDPSQYIFYSTIQRCLLPCIPQMIAIFTAGTTAQLRAAHRQAVNQTHQPAWKSSPSTTCSRTTLMSLPDTR